MTQLTLQQAAAIYQVPLSIVLQTRQNPTDDDWRHFLTWALGPMVEAMSQAMTADDDLFSPSEKDDQDLAVKGDTDALIKLDPAANAVIQHTQVQDGLRLPDELRAEDGYGPLPPLPEDWQQTPGQVPQITPVGGAPNPTVDPNAPAPTPTDGVSVTKMLELLAEARHGHTTEREDA
jgi:hypothetical protein